MMAATWTFGLLVGMFLGGIITYCHCRPPRCDDEFVKDMDYHQDVADLKKLPRKKYLFPLLEASLKDFCTLDPVAYAHSQFWAAFYWRLRLLRKQESPTLQRLLDEGCEVV